VLVLHPPLETLTVTRPFVYAGSPFAAGLHRGIDLAARPGARAAAPCAGMVAWAGLRGVTLRCGRFRVTLLPLGAVVAREGAAIEPGAPLGRASDEALHLGVRRAGDQFGYVDPAPLFERAQVPRAGPPPVAARRPTIPSIPRREMREPGVQPLAPWPAWAGLALALGGVRLRRRGRARSSPRATAARAARSP
jgi:hypothetical protein